MAEPVIELNQNTIRFRELMQAVSSSQLEAGRDLYDIYGYPRHYQYKDGYHAIRREGIANRVAAGVAKSCWRNGFELTESVDSDEGEAPRILSPEMDALKGADVLGRLERADILNRIGNFSVLYVGIPDGRDPREPVGRVRGDAYRRLYFRPFSYPGATVSQYETDVASPRYGLPKLYQLHVVSFGQDNKSIIPAPIIAHYTRVVHLAENRLDNEVEGICALEPIYNRILDLDKVCGGSAEAYFRNARAATVFEVSPEIAANLFRDPAAKDAFDAEVKKFTNQWKDHLTSNAKAYTLDTPQQDPLETVRAILWGIAGHTGIRIRILTGEGSGQLAGSEDKIAYNALVNDRQSQTCAGWVRDLLGVLEMAGMLRLPDTYSVYWPKEEPLSEAEQADVNNKQAATLKTLTEASSLPGGDSVDLDSAMSYFGLGDITTDDGDGDLDGE